MAVSVVSTIYRHCRLLPVISCVLATLLVFSYCRKTDTVTIFQRDLSNEWFIKYIQCATDAILSLTPNTLYSGYALLMTGCERQYYSPLVFPLKILPNMKEVKHARMPIRHLKDDEKCVVAMFGIGKNVAAETELRKIYPKHCHFYGLDPNPNPNKELLEAINGTYYEAAIASKTGKKEAVLLTDKGYKPFVIKHVALKDYLTNQMETTNIIDWLSIDIEGGEVDLFPSLLKDGTFDKMNISICQLNMELHLENDDVSRNTAIYNFLRDTTVERRFIFMKVTLPYYNRITYYAVNVKDPICIERYVRY